MMNHWGALQPDDFGRELMPQAAFAKALAAIPELAHLPAYNFAAVPELMRQLGDSIDLTALALRAADPNTPPEALIFLAGICPAEFCRNPVLPLLLLENPALPAQFEPTSLGRLLSYAAVPADLLAAIAHLGHPDLAHAARLHIGLAGEAGPAWVSELAPALAGLTTVPDDDLLALLLLLDLVPGWLRERAIATVERRQTHLPAARQLLPLAEALEPDELARLLTSDSPRERARAAADPRLPPTLLAEAKAAEDWGDGDYGVYEALARNPSTPPAVLIELAADRKALATGTRRAIAANLASPPEALALLADEYYALDIPLALAAHGNLSPEQRARMTATAIERASLDANPFYRAIALAWPATPTDRLVAQVLAPHWIVRLAVARNPTTPGDARALLAEDGNRFVRAAARTTARSKDAPAGRLSEPSRRDTLAR